MPAKCNYSGNITYAMQFLHTVACLHTDDVTVCKYPEVAVRQLHMQCLLDCGIIGPCTNHSIDKCRPFSLMHTDKSHIAQYLIATVYGLATGETPDETVTTPWRSFNLWASPEMHSMIVKAAYDGAQAMMNSPSGHLMRMVSNVMVRVDVVLGAQWDSDGQILLWPMINEMDWFNSAAMMSGFWKGTLPVDIAIEGHAVAFGSEDEEISRREARVIKEMQSSAGLKLAQALYMEILDT